MATLVRVERVDRVTVLTLDQLRERHSVKWRHYPPDVLTLFVAEMDTPLAPPVAEALSTAVARGDTGYANDGGLAEAYAGFSADRFGWGRARSGNGCPGRRKSDGPHFGSRSET